MRILYPAKITYNKKDKSLEGCLSEGSTSMEDALKNAREALTGYLSSLGLSGVRYRNLPKEKIEPTEIFFNVPVAAGSMFFGR